MSTQSDARRRVLVVAYDFPPHAAIGTMRTLRVVRQLHARGWDVTVLTGDPSSYLPSTPVDTALIDMVPAGVRVLRAGAVRPWEHLQRALRPRSTRTRGPYQIGPGATPPRSAHVATLARVKDMVDAVLSIPDRESGWLAPAFSRGVICHLRATRPHVIYSSAPPWTGQLVAAGLKFALGRPWVADFRDPWARAPWRGDRYRFAVRAAAALERQVIRCADRVVFVAAANRDNFAERYGAAAASKFEVVPNGCDPAEFEALRNTIQTDDGTLVLLHAGSLYAGRTPLPLLKAIAIAIARGGIDPRRFRLRFLGANALQGLDLPGTCRELGLQDIVEFLPRVPRERSLRAMMSASALLLLQPGHTVSVPGKLYEYLAAGRPILAIAEEGETAQIVRTSGAGVSVTPDDEGVIADALIDVLQRARARFELPRELFDGNVGAARIADVLDDVVRQSAAFAGREDGSVLRGTL